MGNAPSNGLPNIGNTAFAEVDRGSHAADAPDGAVGPDVQPKATAPATPIRRRRLMALSDAGGYLMVSCAWTLTIQ